MALLYEVLPRRSMKPLLLPTMMMMLMMTIMSKSEAKNI